MVAHQPGAEEELIVVTFAHYADLVVSHGNSQALRYQQVSALGKSFVSTF
jgi:hypothetical protein